jgi:peptide/nickel transport system substrate-binding protein
MKRSGSVAVLGALGLLAAACGGGGGDAEPSGGGSSGGTFTFAIRADPGQLDPAMATLTVTNTVLGFAYDTLVRQDADGKITPGLAEKWDVKPASVTFTVRKGVTCADGSALTPSDVAENVNHIADPATKSPLYGVAIPVGMKATADDAVGTVTLETPKPFSFILESATQLFAVCGKGLQDRSVLDHGTSGTGPYTLAEAVPSDHYTFKVRDDYTWGPGGATTKQAGQPGTIVLKVVPNEQTAANLLISGDINGALIYGSDRTRLKSSPGVTSTELPAGNGQFFYHEGDGHPGADPAVRKALTQLIDMKQLIPIASSGNGRAPSGLVLQPRPCQGDTVTGHIPAYDAAGAAAALDAAGWAKGADGIRAKGGKKLSLRLLYPTTAGSGTQAAAEFLGESWKKAGVDVHLKGANDVALSQSIDQTGDWDVAWVPISVTLPSQLVGFLSGPAAPKGANFAHLDNADYERLVAEAAQMPGPEGCERWLGAESALFENADLVPVMENTIVLASKNAKIQAVGQQIIPTSIKLTQTG